MQVKGIVKEVKKIEKITGISKANKPWTMWVSKINVNGTQYGLKSFDFKKLEAQISGIALGDEVFFEAAQEGNFLNVLEDSKIEVVSQGNAVPESKPTQSSAKPISVVVPKEPNFEAIIQKTIETCKALESETGDMEEIKRRTDVFVAFMDYESSKFITDLIQFNKVKNMNRFEER